MCALDLREHVRQVCASTVVKCDQVPIWLFYTVPSLKPCVHFPFAITAWLAPIAFARATLATFCTLGRGTSCFHISEIPSLK